MSNDDILAFVQGQLGESQLSLVHEHVDQCELCQRLVNEAAHALDADPISESTCPSWNTVFQSNSNVGGRFRIIRLIARGGMGEVYEAFDTELQERLAIKTVTSTASDSARAVKSLKAEVQLARRISHPNVCRIYDFRTHVIESSGVAIHFLVMEFVEGECLGMKLREYGALPLDDAQSIAHQLLLGLRAAHQAGILHRDFKSDNVMLRTEANGHVVPVILDFGLAKALNESGIANITLTQEHGMIGTVGYMAPEQVEGGSLSASSDLYAFGVVWFEMLTGQLPFSGGSAAADAIARLHRSPVAPSSLNHSVPKWLDEIVLCCLSRQRQQRFESAEAVLDALAIAMASSHSSRTPHGRKWWLATSIAASALVILGLTAMVARPGVRVDEKPVVPLTVATQAAQLPPQTASMLPRVSEARPSPSAPMASTPFAAPARPPRVSRSKRTTPIAAAAPQPPVAPRSDEPSSLPPKKKPHWLPIWSNPNGSERKPTVN